MAVFNTENIRATVWIALKRLDLNDNRVTALREVPIPSGAKILAQSFRLDTSQKILKIRNNRGCLIPLNCSMPPNSKQMPYVLEVARNYQHVNPRPRSIPMTVINKTLKSRLQSVVKRIERLEELLPQIKLKHHEKMTKDVVPSFLSEDKWYILNANAISKLS
ncbi:si:zfos- isoform X1 [Labeo rohita]|uniref:Si:zfos-isoform X1 n=1 Tax=Labeo rohita TaxID=84645 RepID=A0A498NA69_LABRO|nr:si:zfos- isoform X1 [Labeo rohita]